MDNKQKYILCAAIKRNAPKFEKDSMYHNNDLNYIEIGYRHHDIFQRFKGEVSQKLDDQGFYTSKGRFVDRHEAMYVAWSSGQVNKKTAFKTQFEDLRSFVESGNIITDEIFKKYFNKLYSEDLY